MRTGVHFTVSDEQHSQLEAIAADGNSSRKHAWRARIILLSDEGFGTMAIMAKAGVSSKATALSDPPAEETHWTVRALAAVVGLASSTVHRILVRHKIAPHRWRHSEISTDPEFEEKVNEVVGLHVNPPEHAVVLSVDEKTQIQALGRTRKGLPMKPGQPATMTHDYRRHGTTTLFAALDILTGKAVGRHSKHHRHQEFIEFLEQMSMPK